MKKTLLITIVTMISIISTAMAQRVTVQVLDKYNSPIPNAPVYVEILSKSIRLNTGGGIPFPESYYKLDHDKMWKTNANGEAIIDLKISPRLRSPRIQIRVDVIGYSKGRATWSSENIGDDENGQGSFVFPDLEPNQILTPDTIPSIIVAKTYYADSNQVQKNILRAVKKLQNYEYIPGYK